MPSRRFNRRSNTHSCSTFDSIATESFHHVNGELNVSLAHRNSRETERNQRERERTHMERAMVRKPREQNVSLALRNSRETERNQRERERTRMERAMMRQSRAPLSLVVGRRQTLDVRNEKSNLHAAQQNLLEARSSLEISCKALPRTSRPNIL